MKVAAIQSNYIPWKGYFDIINDADCFVFYDEVKYTKNSWRNRNQISSKSGLHWLTIPIGRDAVKLKISEVEVLDSDWQVLHHKSLVHCYASAKYFSQLRPIIDEMLLEKKWSRLIDVNRFAITRVSNLLGIKTQFLDLKDFTTTEGRIERLLSLLVQLKATEYITGPSGRDYIEANETLFNEAGIKVIYKDYSGYPEYSQRGSTFAHNVSVLDMFANVELGRIPELIWGWRAPCKIVESISSRKSLSI